MATLIVELHCMCLFVPEEATGSMHVLMPEMHGHAGHPGPGTPSGGEPAPGESSPQEHPHHHAETHHAGPGDGPGAVPEESAGGGAPAAPEKHVVRMLHRSFTGQPQGRPMEGWALILDDGRGQARLDLLPPGKNPEDGSVVDVSALSGEIVDPLLLASLLPRGITSRVTFRAGGCVALEADMRWAIGGGEPRRLAREVIWKIENVPDQLTWVRLGATLPPPILSLRELEAEENGEYRIAIHHETERTLPHGTEVSLTPAEVRQHFTAFYTALGKDVVGGKNPSTEGSNPLLPYTEDEVQGEANGEGGGGVMCLTAAARIR
jgi:hypothetical protein